MIDLQLLNQTRPRLYDSVGPLRHRWLQQRPTSVTGMTMALVRIVQALPAQAPASLEAQYDRSGVRLAPLDPNAPSDTYAVRTQVEQDLKTLAGFKRAQQEAVRFMEWVEADGWTTALARLNQEVGEKLKERPQDPNLFALEVTRSIRQAQTSQLYTLRKQGQQNPLALAQHRYLQIRTLLGRQLYPLVSPETDRLDQAQLLVFEPESSVYCIHDIRINRLTLEEYQKTQEVIHYRENYVQAQSLAVEHFNPSSIIKRSRFAWEESLQETDDANDVQS